MEKQLNTIKDLLDIMKNRNKERRKKRRKTFLIVFSIVIIVIGGTIPFLPFMLNWDPKYGPPSLEFPFLNPNDVIWLRGYNLVEEGDAPSDYHTGIDLKIENSSIILSPCTGTIGLITSTVHEIKGHIMISINIRINLAWSVMIVFEPYSNSTVLHEEQLSLINAKFGQHIETGDQLGTLLNGGEFPHIHFTVRHNFKSVCPFNYSSLAAQTIFLEVATRTNSTICYP